MSTGGAGGVAGAGPPPGTVSRDAGAAPAIEYGSGAAPPRATFRVPQAGQTNSPGPGISSSERHRPQRTIIGVMLPKGAGAHRGRTWTNPLGSAAGEHA